MDKTQISLLTYDHRSNLGYLSNILIGLHYSLDPSHWELGFDDNTRVRINSDRPVY